MAQRSTADFFFRETTKYFHVALNFLRDSPRNLRLQNELPLMTVLTAINILEYYVIYIPTYTQIRGVKLILKLFNL